MDSTELDELLEEAEASEEPLVKRLRKSLRDQGKDLKKVRIENEDLQTKVAASSQAELFTEAGIPDTPQGKLLRKALQGESDLTVEKIQAEAAVYGLIEPPTPTAGEGEQEAHEMVAAALGTAPAAELSFEEQVANATSREEVEALVASHPKMGMN